MKRYFLTKSLVVLVALLIGICSTAEAQDGDQVRFKTKSKMRIESLGFLAGMLDSETVEEVSIAKGYKRADQKDTSTITDIPNRRIINLNHKEKEYSVITFEDMMAMLEEAGQYAQGRVDSARQDMADEDVPEYTVEFKLTVNDTGKEKKFDGKKAGQKVMVIETIFEPKDASADTLPSGSLFVINDMWLATDLPEMRVAEEFNRDLGEELNQELGQMNLASILSNVLKSDPRIGNAMEKAKEEMKKVDGYPLATTTIFVTVPAEKELDLELALGEKKEEKSGGGFGGFGNIVKQAAGIDTGDDEQPKEAKQSTVLKMEQWTEDISDKKRKMEYFRIPTNYDEVEYERPQLPTSGG